MTKFTVTFELPSWLVRPGLALLLLWRRLCYGCAFRKIPLTQGRFALIDPADFPRLNRYKWRLCRTRGKNVLYAERSIRLPNGRYSRILMHREVLSLSKGELIKAPAGYVIDHINGNGLDNRRANLRLATVAQNAWNSRKRNSRSGYKGVWFAADKGLWRAAIVYHGRRIHLGYFKDKIAAAKAYDAAARKYYREYAKPNFPKKANRRLEEVIQSSIAISCKKDMTPPLASIRPEIPSMKSPNKKNFFAANKQKVEFVSELLLNPSP
jgi:hypothetical protein